MDFNKTAMQVTIDDVKHSPVAALSIILLTVNPMSIGLIIILVTSFFIRLAFCLPGIIPTGEAEWREPGTPTRLMVILGSGGHTAEMLLLLKGLDRSKFQRRTYIVTAGDNFSSQKAVDLEDELDAAAGIKAEDRVLEDGTTAPRGFDIMTLPRPRKIHEATVSAIRSTLRCWWACRYALRGNTTKALRVRYGPKVQYPDVIVCNGPGINVCMAAAVAYGKLFFMNRKTRIIYVESFARVKTLSVTGNLMWYFADNFIVQWPELAEKVHGEYHGNLVLNEALKMKDL